MSHISTVSTTAAITLENKEMMLVKEHHYRQSPASVLRPAYEPGYTEANSYAIDLENGEVKIVRPLQTISAGRGFRRGF